MGQNILVVAAHPDDEVLGCGGTIAKHSKAGDDVHILIVGEGITSRESMEHRAKMKSEVSELAEKAMKAGKVLGAKSVHLMGFADNRLDSYDLLDIIKPIEEKVLQIKPTTIYTHFGFDLGIDHRIVHEAVATACRPIPGSNERSLLFFEVPSSTGWKMPDGAPAFSPNWFVDISDCLETKIKALEVYASEMRDWPHARSKQAVEYLAKWRGSTVGLHSAESFILGRHIVKSLNG